MVGSVLVATPDSVHRTFISGLGLGWKGGDSAQLRLRLRVGRMAHDTGSG